MGRDVGQVLTSKVHATRFEAGGTHQCGDQGGLAHAVAAQQCQTAAGIELERNIFQHQGIAIAGADLFKSQQLSHRVTPPDRLP